jgi:hypothetical protein
LIGLGFVRRALYLTPDFFRGKPVGRLLGPGIAAEVLSGDASGRGMAAIYEFGVGPFYFLLASGVVKQLGLSGAGGHLDSTGFPADGEYNSGGRQRQRPGGFPRPRPAATVFLKSPRRSMALCLMVCAALEHRIRQGLAQQHQAFPDQKGKPTARRVFQSFTDIHTLTLPIEFAILGRWIPSSPTRDGLFFNALAHNENC